MSTQPVREDARRRLQEAQRKEATALASLTRAQVARERVHSRLVRADDNVARSVAILVRTSGLERAAQLLDQSVVVVRRLNRDGIKALAQEDGSARGPD